jgi:hypothetical protein
MMWFRGLGAARCDEWAWLWRHFSPDNRTVVDAVNSSLDRGYAHDLDRRMLRSLHKDMK